MNWNKSVVATNQPPADLTGEPTSNVPVSPDGFDPGNVKISDNGVKLPSKHDMHAAVQNQLDHLKTFAANYASDNHLDRYLTALVKDDSKKKFEVAGQQFTAKQILDFMNNLGIRG